MANNADNPEFALLCNFWLISGISMKLGLLTILVNSTVDGQAVKWQSRIMLAVISHTSAPHRYPHSALYSLSWIASTRRECSGWGILKDSLLYGQKKRRWKWLKALEHCLHPDWIVNESQRTYMGAVVKMKEIALDLLQNEGATPAAIIAHLRLPSRVANNRLMDVVLPSTYEAQQFDLNDQNRRSEQRQCVEI